MASRTEHSFAITLPPIWVKGILVVVLTALAGVAILPAYLTGQWPWVAAPKVAQIDQLKALSENGLDIPGWSLQMHQPITINGKDWSLGEYTASQPAITAPTFNQIGLLLRPQPWHSDQPEVEWVDLQGAQHWQLDDCRRVAIAPSADAQATAFTARLCRGWNDQQTLALLQWYAWPEGGHPAPSHWFWSNQWSQFSRRSLTPWVAVTLLVPIDPLGDIAAYQPQITTLGSRIQQTLTAAITNGSAPLLPRPAAP